MSAAPRIVLVVDVFPAPSETFIVQRFVKLLERGWDMHVVCDRKGDLSGFPELHALRDVDERIHPRLPVRPRLLALALWPYIVGKALLRSPRALLRYISYGWRQEGAHVLRRLSYDAAFVLIGPDVIHFKFGWFAIGGEHLGRYLGAKLIVSFQGADVNYGGLEKDPGYYDAVWSNADAIHFLSTDLRDRAIRRGYRPDGRDVLVVPGIDLSRFTPVTRPPGDGRPLNILSVGRLHWKKGYGYALEAVRRLVDQGIDVRYRIIGDGPEREDVIFTRSDLGLDAVVELLGSQPLERVKDEMRWADVFLHSATSEGYCYAAVEAQASGIPVVTSDADGLSENVADGESGFVVGRRDAAALADRLALLARDPELRARLGEQARARAERVFDVGREIEGFEEMYRATLAAER